MRLFKKVQNRIIYELKTSAKKSQIRELFNISAKFIHQHPQSKTYLFVLESPATLPALGFFFFRLAENRTNIKLVLSDAILQAYEPHIHRWHAIGCLELVKAKKVSQFQKNPQVITISENENIPHAIVLKPFSETNKNLPLIPYTLHPHQVFTGKLFFLDYFRKSTRLHKIMFSGNYHESSYNKSFKEYPHVINRFKALQFLKNSVNDISYPESKSEYFQSNKFFQWIDWNSASNLERRIDEHEWLKVLSSSSFSLCLPGVHMPMCHNIIESMAVGTIPITQYGFLFDPPLVHGKNCIKFDNAQDLLTKLDEINKMSDSQIEELRTNVIDYFENHIDPKNVIREIESSIKPYVIQYFKEY